jgi:hypothetical protein
VTNSTSTVSRQAQQGFCQDCSSDATYEHTSLSPVSCSILQGADWLYTAKGAERQIDRILGQYYEPERSPSSRGAQGKKDSERANPRAALDKIAQVIDSRMMQLRRQEDEVSPSFKLMCEHKSSLCVKT